MAFLSGDTWKGHALTVSKVGDSDVVEACALYETLKVAETQLCPDTHNVKIYTDCQAVIDDMYHVQGGGSAKLPAGEGVTRLTINLRANFDSLGID